MSQQQEDGQQEEGEGGLDAMPVYPDKGPDRDEMAASYLPEQDDWLAKTVLDLNDPHAAAALSQFYRLFPEVDDLQEVIDGFSDEFYRGKTSVGGAARQDYQRLLEAMHGGNASEEAKRWQRMLGVDMDEE